MGTPIENETTVINRETVIEGNVKCDSLRLEGKVYGDVAVGGSVELLEGAEVSGELSTASIKFEAGVNVGKFRLTDN